MREPLGHFAWLLMTPSRYRRRAWTTICAVALQAALLPAQPIERSIALGVAVPAGDYAKTRTVGPAIRAGFTIGSAETRRARLRIELEGAWLLSRGVNSGVGYADPGSLSAMSVLASLVVGRRPTQGMAPYFLTGLAIQSLTIPGLRNSYGSTFGVRVRRRITTSLRNASIVRGDGTTLGADRLWHKRRLRNGRIYSNYGWDSLLIPSGRTRVAAAKAMGVLRA